MLWTNRWSFREIVSHAIWLLLLRFFIEIYFFSIIVRILLGHARVRVRFSLHHTFLTFFFALFSVVEMGGGVSSKITQATYIHTYIYVLMNYSLNPNHSIHFFVNHPVCCLTSIYKKFPFISTTISSSCQFHSIELLHVLVIIIIKQNDNWFFFEHTVGVGVNELDCR